MYKFRIPIAILCLLLALLGSRWVDHAGGAPARPSDEFAIFQISFRGWAELDLDLMPGEVEAIRPEGMLMRRYESEHGEAVELTVIASRDKRTLHSAQHLPSGSGFGVERQESRMLSLPGREIPAVHSILANNKGERMVSVHFFTDGNFVTDNVTRYQLNQLVRRLKGGSPVGALVRVAAPIRTDAAAADALMNEFARIALPKAMDAVRELGQR